MFKKVVSIITVVAFVLSLFVNVFPQNVLADGDQPIYLDPSKPVEERVADLLSRMTLDEKIGQMVQADIRYIQPEDVKNYYLGSVLSGGGGWPNQNPETNTISDWKSMITNLQNQALSTRLKIPILYAVDAVHGHNNVKDATIFPHNIGLGATRDPDLLKRIGQAVAKEVKATGVHWTFAPCVGVPEDERWGRTYECFGEDVNLVADLATAFVKGLQGDQIDDLKNPDKVIATLKHYIGEGATDNGKNKGDVTRYTQEEVLQKFLKPYEDAIRAGARAVMLSYNSIQGVKCHGNKAIIDKLKVDLNFDGIVITDWNGIDDLPGSTYNDKIKIAVNAGVDMFMVPDKWKTFITGLKTLVQNGEVSIDRINDAVSRILRVKFQSGLFEHPYPDESLAQSFGSPEHRELAREAVRKSLVLLKNKNKIVKNLKNFNKIFVAGKAANDLGLQCGGWTISWQGKSDNDPADGLAIGPATTGTTIWQAIKKAFGVESTQTDDVVVPIASEVVQTPNGKILKFNKHGRGAAGFDVAIVVIGERPYAESNGDTNDLTLDEEDRATLENIRKEAPNIPIVVVMIAGRPLQIDEYINDWDALIMAWLPGSEGEGITDVLFGDYDFTGKLPITWPWYIEQLPKPFEKTDVLFPYGYGLTKDEDEPIPQKPEKPLPPAQNIAENPKVEAENYYAMKGIDTENTSDTGGGRNVGWIDSGDWLDYYISVPQDGLYKVNLRVASPSGAAGGLLIKNNVDQTLAAVDIPATGGWQNWTTVTTQIPLYSGVQKIRIYAGASGWNINWFSFERISDIPANWQTPGSEQQTTVPSSPVLRSAAVEVYYSSESMPSDRTWYYSPKDIKYKLDKQPNIDTTLPLSSFDGETIKIDPSKEYQPILGIGISMEESTVYNLSKLSKSKRQEVLRKLFSPEEGAGISLVRLTIGTADFTGRAFYTYADIPYDQVPRDKDVNYYLDLLEQHFSIQKDIDYNIIPVIKEILEINPNVKFFASPWTPPGWMKTKNPSYKNNPLNLKGGQLEDKFIPVLARYYRKYVEEYAKQGINIYAMTLQNEPQLEIDYPSCRMTPEQELALAKALKQEFTQSVAEGKLTPQQVPKIWAFDHNFDSAVSFLSGILGDDAIDGAAFHDYAGDPSAMTTVKIMFPNKSIHLTERSVWGVAGADRIIQYFRNYAESYNAWVTMLDSDIFPEQWTGTPDPTLLIRDSGNEDNYWETPEYYILAQFTKFVKPGAVRIDSNYGSKSTVTNVAFKNPDGKVISIVANQNNVPKLFRILCNGEQIATVIPAKTVATYIWTPVEGVNPIGPLKIPASFQPGDKAVAISQGIVVAQNGDLKNVATGEYADFYITVPESAYYAFDVWYENYDDTNETSEPSSILIKKDDKILGELKLEITNKPGTGWGEWKHARANVYLEAGVQTIRLYVAKAHDASLGGMSIKRVFVDHNIPGRINADEFIEVTNPVETLNGMVGYFDHTKGDTLIYKVYINKAGTYKLRYGYATNDRYAKVKIFLDEQELTPQDGLPLPYTGGWGWDKLGVAETEVTISKTGEAILKVTSAGESDHNFGWLEIGPALEVKSIEASDGSNTIKEGQENGTVITIALNNAVFGQVYNFSLVGAPDGVQIGQIEKVNDNTVKITLSGNSIVDYDIDKYPEVVMAVYNEETSQVEYTLSTRLTFVAIDDPEVLTASWDPNTNGNISTMDNEVITLTLTGGTFNPSNIDKIKISGNATDYGIGIKKIEYVDAHNVKIYLRWDGTLYYEDLQLNVNIPPEAYSDSTFGEILTATLMCKGKTGDVVNHLGTIVADEVYKISGAKVVRENDYYKITDIGTGDWIEFKVNIPADGKYTTKLIVKNLNGATIQFRNAENAIMKTVTLPKIWEGNWFTLKYGLNLSKGVQSIKLYITAATDTFELREIELQPVSQPLTIPGKIEAEDFIDTSKGVILSLSGTNYKLGYLSAGDWMKYYVNVRYSGEYQVSYRYATTQSGVKAVLKKDNQQLSEVSLPATGDWSTFQIASGTLTLEKGIYEITLYDIGDGFDLDYIQFEFTGQIPVEKVSVPRATPVPGTYNDSVTVSLSCETVGAKIYYTLDGTEPSTSSNLYVAPLVIDKTTTIKAIAVKEGMEKSDVAVFTYIINKQQTSGGTSSGTQSSTNVGSSIGTVITEQTETSKSQLSEKQTQKEEVETSKEPRINYSVEQSTLNIQPEIAGNKVLSEKFVVSIDEKLIVGKAEKVNTLNIDLKNDTLKTVKEFVVEIPIKALKNEQTIIIKTNMADVEVPVKYLKQSISDEEKTEVSLRKVENIEATFGEEQKVKVSGIELKMGTESSLSIISSVKVSVPYTPSIEELKLLNLVVYKVENGKLVAVPLCKYDKQSKTMKFITNGDGVYTVLNVQKKEFKDVSDYSWAKAEIENLASREVIKGVAKDKFEPGSKIKRADFVALIVRTLGINMAVDDNFSDVSKDAYYYNEVGIAKKLGIVKGTRNNNFKPEDTITREEMMVIISRVLTICNAKVEKGDKNELAIYNDRDMISEYAIEDVATLIKNGIIKGSQNNIKPKAITTRAEAAVVIYRLVNLLLN